MTEIINGVFFDEFYLTVVRVLKLISIFKEQDYFQLTEKKIIMYDFYMRFPFMTAEEKSKSNFDEEYAFYYWKPNYSLYDAVLAILVSKKMISVINEKENLYSIEENGEYALLDTNCDYMNVLSETGKYILSTVCKLSDKKINDDIIQKSKGSREV